MKRETDSDERTAANANEVEDASPEPNGHDERL
jgi:hypothetical protein